MDPFVICKSYGETLELLWTDIESENIEKLIEIGCFVQKSTRSDKILFHNKRMARTLPPAPLLQGPCRALLE